MEEREEGKGTSRNCFGVMQLPIVMCVRQDLGLELDLASDQHKHKRDDVNAACSKVLRILHISTLRGGKKLGQKLVSYMVATGLAPTS